MKIKTFTRGYSTQPNKCQHEWRMFGTRSTEEVWTPIRNDGKPSGYHGGWIVCDKCGWNPFVHRYEITGKRSANDPIMGPEWKDVMVKVIEWGNEKEPNKPVVDEFAYAEFNWWEKLCSKMRLTFYEIRNMIGGIK